MNPESLETGIFVHYLAYKPSKESMMDLLHRTKNPYGLLFEGNLCEYLSSCLSAALQFLYILLVLLVNHQTSSKKDHAQKVLDLVSLSILPSFLVLFVFLPASCIRTLFCVPLSFLVSLNLLF